MAPQVDNTSDPQSLLPEQYYSGDAKLPGLDGERRLMLAVLEDAVFVAQRHALARDPERRRELHEAREWIAGTDNTWPFSFENICNVLGIDPEYVRCGLKRTATVGGAGKRGNLTAVEPRIMPLEERLRRVRAEGARLQDSKLRIAS